MNQWWAYARFYLANSGPVLLAPDNKYAAHWSVRDDQFPSAEAVRVFKKFRIIFAQWEEVQDQLRDNVYQVAFTGMTELDVRHGQSLEQGK